MANFVVNLLFSRLTTKSSSGSRRTNISGISASLLHTRESGQQVINVAIYEVVCIGKNRYYFKKSILRKLEFLGKNVHLTSSAMLEVNLMLNTSIKLTSYAHFNADVF